jgi:O-antigen/teichoic acid export membrane protein
MFKDLSYMKGVFGLGMKFFLIQIAGIVLFSTGNMLVTQLFTPDHVVSYNLAFQFFGVSNMLFSIILAPYWTSVTDAFFKQEFDWIKLSMKRMIRISYFFILLLVLMIFIAPFIYDIWVGSGIGIEPSINIWMALLFIIIVFYSPYTYFINGIGKIKLQMYSLILSSLVNIPLCVFLAKNMQMGVGGVVAGSVISLLPHAILSPIQYYKIINQKANGIWLA